MEQLKSKTDFNYLLLLSEMMRIFQSEQNSAQSPPPSSFVQRTFERLDRESKESRESLNKYQTQFKEATLNMFNKQLQDQIKENSEQQTAPIRFLMKNLGYSFLRFLLAVTQKQMAQKEVFCLVRGMANETLEKDEFLLGHHAKQQP